MKYNLRSEMLWVIPLKDNFDFFVKNQFQRSKIVEESPIRNWLQ